MKEEVLKKLGLKERGAYNILNNEELCKRIINETPIWLDAFALKHGISKFTLLSLVRKKVIASFSNIVNKGSKIFIFEDEALEQFKLNYCPNNLYRNARYIIELYLLRAKDSLTAREHEIMYDSLINNVSDESLAKKYDLTYSRIQQLHEKTYSRLRLAHRISVDYEKLKSEYDILRFDVELLKQKKKSLNQYLSKKEDKVVEKNFEHLDLELLNKSILDFDFDFSVRVKNCLKAHDIETIKDIVVLNRRDFAKMRNLGRKSIDDIDDVLMKYGLQFGMDIPKYLFDTLKETEK